MPFGNLQFRMCYAALFVRVKVAVACLRLAGRAAAGRNTLDGDDPDCPAKGQRYRIADTDRLAGTGNALAVAANLPGGDQFLGPAARLHEAQIA